MTATITVTAADYNYGLSVDSFRSALKDGLAGIGITSGQIVYDSVSHVICKISNGSGTYADNYLRFEKSGLASSNTMQMGTGWTSGTEVTGAGTEQGGFYAPNGNFKHRIIKADDGTFGVVQIVSDSTNLPIGMYGYVMPTNTTETANSIPLVMGLGSIHSYNGGQNGTTLGPVLGTASNPLYNLNSVALRYRNSLGSYLYLNSEGNMRMIYSATKKGNNTFDALGSSALGFGGNSSSSDQYLGNAVYSIAFGLDSTIDGNVPIMPNVPIKSGGVAIGYNSNLVFCPPNLIPGDNIIVSAGVEEYTVISSDGIAIRRV